MDDLPNIALLIESPTRKRHWRQLLSGVNCKLIADTDLAGGCTAVDIVVTDGQHQPDDSPAQKMPSDIYGVIGIGAEIPADVVLSDTSTEHELRLACDLLFEIVQLRREREASKHTRQLLTELADLDGLTGLANRRAWDRELTARMSHVDEGGATLCLALFDLDHFKQINTTHGYAVADNVLQQAANALKASTRTDDFVARIGGDELGVLLSSISAERAESVVERIRANIESSLARTGSVIVSATAGLAIRQPTHDAASLFDAADRNLRHGKAVGRNRTIASS